MTDITPEVTPEVKPKAAPKRKREIFAYDHISYGYMENYTEEFLDINGEVHTRRAKRLATIDIRAGERIPDDGSIPMEVLKRMLENGVIVGYSRITNKRPVTLEDLEA